MRVLNPDVGSPLASFLTDPASVNIVGALAYNNGDTQDVPGIKTLGPNTLRISLVAPNPLLPTLMALPPTGAVATNLPYSPITSVNSSKPLPAGGRYYVQEYVPDRSIKIRKNPYYRARGAPPTPGQVDGFDYDIGTQQDQALLLVKSGQLDWAADGLPPSAWGPLFAQYGTKGRAQVFSTSVFDYVTMNNTKGVVQVRPTPARLSPGASAGTRSSTSGARGPVTRSATLLTPAIPGYKKCTAFREQPEPEQGSAACFGAHR